MYDHGLTRRDTVMIMMEHLPVVPHDKVLLAGLQVVLAEKNVEQRGLLRKHGIKKGIDYSFAPSNQAW